MTRIASRYARAAVDWAWDEGREAGVKDLLQGVEDFVTWCNESSDLQELLRSPALKAQRQELLPDVMRQCHVAESASRLVLLLAERNRSQLLPDVVLELRTLVDERLERLRAHVETAAPLNGEQTGRLTRTLEERFGKPVVVVPEVRPDLLGGFVIRVGDASWDLSLKTQVAGLRQDLTRGM